ncbi:fibronectin-binding protein [Enterococcus sp. HSIEG1]|nr:fibronectin-binding protein [Enterococcus sp. HSIEG1]
MFLSLTKSGGDGTYTKRGNYICRDSEQCNQQMEQRETLDEFVSLLQMR